MFLFYDFREIIRRRSFYGMLRFLISIDLIVEFLLDVVMGNKMYV